MNQRLALVTGVTGYIGGRLVPELLAAGFRVRAMARNPRRLRDRPWYGDVEIAEADAGDADQLRTAMEGVDVAYYLIHSLGTGHRFEARDRHNALTFGTAAREAGVRRIVYLGGLLPRGRRTVAAPGLPPRGGRDPARVRRTGRRTAGSRDPRIGLGVVRDAPPPHRSAAGDGHPSVAEYPDPADRRPRRTALPGRKRRHAGRA